jgi:hypothetical protein
MEDVIGLLNEHRETIVAGVSAFVAVIAAFFSSRETRKQRNILKETLRQRLDEASLDWGDEAINALAEAEGLASFTKTQSFAADRSRVAQALSALADRGRMFFPNTDQQKKGADKEGAFRGSRAPILEALIFAHLELKSIDPPHKGNAEFINRCRRLVVSELQAHLDPRQRDEIVGRYNRQRKTHQEEAKRLASVLRAELQSNRPYVFKDDARESQSDD